MTSTSTQELLPNPEIPFTQGLMGEWFLKDWTGKERNPNKSVVAEKIGGYSLGGSNLVFM